LRAADSLPGAELLGLTTLAVSRHADCPALAGAVDLAATAILDELIAFPFAELAAVFRMALPLLPLSVMTVMIGGTASSATATTDNRLIAAATGAPRDRQGGARSDAANCGNQRRDQSAQRQPARSGSA
jgi:hypothetical protein